tara:strand:+ start:155 stop:556 length:402 start_codon:yes stop_codon:yes gene_type:complete
LTKEVLETKSWVPNHSTVTECVRYDVLCQNSLDKNNDYILDLSFTLSIRTSKLTKTSHYNSYQQQLYKLVKFLKERGKLGYRRISHILYDRSYRTVRTNKPILNNYVYSIYKKGKIRENRIERSFDSKIDNLN